MYSQRSLFIFLPFLLFLLCSSAVLSAQTYTTAKTLPKKSLKWYEKALAFEKAEKYGDALSIINRLLAEDPNFIDGYLRKAAILYDQKKYAEAEESFELAAHLGPDYKSRTWYQLAIVEMRQDKYSEAASHFETYLTKEKRSEKLIARAKKHLVNSQFAAKAIKNPVPFQPKSIGNNINTPGFEYLPSITADGEFLVYTARVNNQEDLFFSRLKDGEWQKGEALTAINTPFNEATQTLSADGRLLIYTACNRKDGLGGCDLYFSEARTDRWTPPLNMGQMINTRAWDSQPSLSANGKVLYFASERNGGKGKRDLWFSLRHKDGNWGRPQNLGATLNTAGNEQAPFIHPDGQTLYFMSDGHPGMGDYDLFLSRKQADGSWGKPENLGYPINTRAHEGALFVSLDGKTAYFASDKNFEEETDGNLRRSATDIYYFELPPKIRPLPVTYVKAVVKDQQTKKRLQASTEIIDLETGNLIQSQSTSKDGSFLITLPVGKNYALNVSKKGYLFHSENFELDQSNQIEEPFLLEIELIPIPKNPEIATSAAPVVLKNVFFETGSAALKPASKTELNRLKALLDQHPTMRIQINGHTDNVGTEEANLSLSDNRAKAVQDYLIEQGIKADRLQHKGFGESHPIDTNDTNEGRQKNRRTEFVVVK